MKRAYLARFGDLVGAVFASLVVFFLQWQCDILITDVRYLSGDVISDDAVCVGVTGNRISYIGKNRVRARMTIAGNGLLLSLGFIDVNSCGWLTDKAATLKLKDGITTFLNAHGDSFKADAKKFGTSERLNYATSVGLIPAQAYNLSGKKMIAALEESLRYGAPSLS